MANEVKIVVTGQDQSGAALASATKNARGLAGALEQITKVAAGANLADQFSGMAAGAQKFLSSTVTATSNLEQSLGAVDSVFKSSASQINEWGQTSADSFGLSQRAFNEAVTPIGSMLQNLGFSLEETTGKTHDLTERASDMAATFGGPTKDALDAIQAALRGETDPIERYGVLLNQAAVEARALADTGKSSADALTMQEKAAARLNLIMEQTSSTQGQFAREADTLAGAQQRLTAAWEDAQAALGDAFAPIVKIAADVLTDLLGVFQSLPGPVQFVIGLLAALIAAAVAIAPAVTAAATALGAMGVSATVVAAGVRTLLIALGPIALVVAGVAAAITLFSDDAKQNAEAVSKMRSSLRGLETDGERVVAIMGQLQELNADELFKNLGVSTEDAAKAIAHGGDELESLIGKLEAAKEQTSDFGDQALDAVINSLRGMSDGAQQAAEDTRELAAATAEGGQSADEAAAAYEKQANAILDARDAQRSLQEAIDEANTTIAENGATLDINTEKGRQNQAALDGIAASTLNAVEADRQKGASGAELIGTLNAGREAFISTAIAAGMEASAAVDLANKLGLIPSRVLTRVELDSAAAIANAAAFKRALDNIPRVITTSTYVRAMGTMGGKIPLANAHGGVVGAAQTGGVHSSSTMINEAGPEVVELPTGSRVATAGATRALAEMGAFAPTGGGGGALTIQFAGGTDSLVAQLFMALIRRGSILLLDGNGTKVRVG